MIDSWKVLLCNNPLLIEKNYCKYHYKIDLESQKKMHNTSETFAELWRTWKSNNDINNLNLISSIKEPRRQFFYFK